MKKAIIAGTIVLLVSLIAICFKVDISQTLIIIIAYWVFLDRLEKEDGK